MKIIKCKSCKQFSTTEPFCEYCHRLLATEEIRKQELLKSHNDRLSKPKENHPILEIVKTMQKHRFFVVRILGNLFYGIGFVIFSIISVIAWLLAAIAA